MHLSKTEKLFDYISLCFYRREDNTRTSLEVNLFFIDDP